MEMPDNTFASDSNPAIPGDSLTKPLIIALLALLASRYLGGSGQKTSSDARANPKPWRTILETPANTILEELGWLIERFRREGLEDTVDTWVKSGPNKRVAPRDISAVLGEDVVWQLSRRTGLSRDRVVVELSRLLPTLVDKLTLNGQLPTLQEVARLMAQEAQGKQSMKNIDDTGEQHV